jgi:biopolymer transport protein ExbB
MIDFFLKGGVVMWPILLGSLIGLTIIIEKMITLRMKGKQNSFLLRILEKEKRLDEIKEKIKSFHCPVSEILRAGVENIDKPIYERQLLAEKEGAAQVRDLAKNLNILGLIGHLEPLLGLLGTVTGMIRAFMTIQKAGGQVDANMLAGGIWEALITTAAGLIVAIPIVFFHQFLESRVDTIAVDMQDVVVQFPGIFGPLKFERTERY